MAYTVIDDPTQYFNAILYAGNGGTDRSITGVGFQPDFVWIKERNNAVSHMLYDSVRGANKRISTNNNNSEATDSDGLKSFDSDGWTMDAKGSINGGSDTYVAWNWKGGTTSGLSGGDITPSSYSYDATSGFGVYKYTGNGNSDQTIPHGLGKKPTCIFYKRLDSGTNWVVQSNSLGNRVQLVINDQTAGNTDSRLGASDSWSTTNFLVGTYGDMNSNNDPHIAYVFTDVKGYQKAGTYKGNGNSDGTFIYLGFRPAFFFTKNVTDSGDDWILWDNKRGDVNLNNGGLAPNDDKAEFLDCHVDFLSNGVKLRNSTGRHNGSGDTHFFLAIAESPFVNSNGIPTNAR